MKRTDILGIPLSRGPKPRISISLVDPRAESNTYVVVYGQSPLMIWRLTYIAYSKCVNGNPSVLQAFFSIAPSSMMGTLGIIMTVGFPFHDDHYQNL